ncbi:MAG: serine hydrolase [Bacteroidales bacterium]
MLKNTILAIAILIQVVFTSAQSQNLYFPPVSNTASWDTLSPLSLNWCAENIDSLYDFLEEENTKAFLVLKDGRIALEKYFGTFAQDSLWYWASAGKTLTSFLIGQAQEQGYLDIADTTSDYLGVSWTRCLTSQEEKITLRHQLTMTTGLNDAVPDNHCTLDTCLVYLADAGTRWAYHNAPYTLLEAVLDSATGQPVNTFTQNNLKTPTGMNGFWLMIDYDNVFFSKARSMARFGLLIQNKGIWDQDTLMQDTAYFNQMVNTSQSLNPSYGYLWWLNGKESFMLPGLQLQFPGSYAPDAPDDMIAAMGKNGQILCVSPEQGLVVVRMGNQPNSPISEITPLFCNQIWQKLNAVMCNTTGENDITTTKAPLLPYPNPTDGMLYLRNKVMEGMEIEITNLNGQIMLVLSTDSAIDMSRLPAGVYIISLQTADTRIRQRVIKY